MDEIFRDGFRIVAATVRETKKKTAQFTFANRADSSHCQPRDVETVGTQRPLGTTPLVAETKNHMIFADRATHN